MPRRALGLAIWLLANVLGALLGMVFGNTDVRPISAGTDVPCVLDADRSISPRQVRYRGLTTVTLNLRGACELARRPLHIVLVVDASREMSFWQLDALKKGLADAIRDGSKVKLGERPWVKIGIVSFTGASEAKTLYPYLTNDSATIVAALNNIETDGSICPPNADFECGPSLGLREALSLLRTARDSEARQVVLLATAGDYKPVCDGIQQRAAELAAGGALLVTACAGNLNTCERGCLRDIVAQDRFYFRAPDWTHFDDVLGQIIEAEGPFNPLEGLTVVDALPEALRFAGSDDQDIRVEPGRLTWDFDLTKIGAGEWAITSTYRLEALECGQIQSSRGVTATLRYNPFVWGGPPRSYGLPNPVLVVPCPTATPTATPTAPTATPSPTPSGAVRSASPTPTASQAPTTPTRSPTPRAWHAFLPFLASRACASAADTAAWDAAILVDVSGTMGRPTGGPFGGRQRLDVAREIVAEGILGRGLRPGIDRVALLQFGQVADLLAELGPCCDAARAALGRLDRLSWSFPWNAIDHAAMLLSEAPARPGARRAILLFTDLTPGDLSAEDAALLQLRADAARAAGIDLFAIGLGDKADADGLIRLTGAADRVFLTRHLGGIDPPVLVGQSLRCARR